MSAEPRRVTKPEVWTQWESRVVNGIFPLRRFLGGSNRSAVFLTEYKAQNLADVAIKFVPAETLQTQAQQLVQWGAAATLSHPHLLRIFDVGRCQFGGRDFLFAVMEYAEQTLAQILPQRALSPDEVREMMLPTLDALAFLHRNNMVHGELKPSNFLVVNDQLKLASDTVRPTSNSTTGILTTSLYDPPELKDGVISTAGDIWALGITLVEALTQRTPAWLDERSETASLPAGFPAPFVDTVRRCLNRTPANRPTVIELEAQYKPAPQAHLVPPPQPPAREAPREATPQQNPPKRHVLLPIIATVLLISAAVWVGLRFFTKYSNSPQSTSDSSQAQLQLPAGPAAEAGAGPATGAAPGPAAAAPAPVRAALAPAAPAPAASSPIATNAEPRSKLSSPVSRQPDQPSLPPAATSASVLRQVSPDVPQAIRDKIRGHINVTVRLLVDPSGDVVGEFLEHPGPSRYFARVAGDAAGEWKFAPADTQGSRVWLLHFEFVREGVTVDATAAQ
ncbi:MAG: serine/threonine protein kinase [Gammaproteobacteria bacterium]|nr:serine/threonine protein kinase [Gammaproteobacteria bacterium]